MSILGRNVRPRGPAARASRIASLATRAPILARAYRRRSPHRRPRAQRTSCASRRPASKSARMTFGRRDRPRQSLHDAEHRQRGAGSLETRRGVPETCSDSRFTGYGRPNGGGAPRHDPASRPRTRTAQAGVTAESRQCSDCRADRGTCSSSREPSEEARLSGILWRRGAAVKQPPDRPPRSNRNVSEHVLPLPTAVRGSSLWSRQVSDLDTSHRLPNPASGQARRSVSRPPILDAVTPRGRDPASSRHSTASTPVTWA